MDTNKKRKILKKTKTFLAGSEYNSEPAKNVSLLNSPLGRGRGGSNGRKRFNE